jgi:hypothetical protein
MAPWTGRKRWWGVAKRLVRFGNRDRFDMIWSRKRWWLSNMPDLTKENEDLNRGFDYVAKMCRCWVNKIGWEEKPRCPPNSQEISDGLVILSTEYGVLNKQPRFDSIHIWSAMSPPKRWKLQRFSYMSRPMPIFHMNIFVTYSPLQILSSGICTPQSGDASNIYI